MGQGWGAWFRAMAGHRQGSRDGATAGDKRPNRKSGPFFLRFFPLLFLQSIYLKRLGEVVCVHKRV